MARMIPNVDPTQLEHGSEADVYVALRDQLNGDFVVLHSYPWLRPWRDEGALMEGEADFLILHPDYGLLILEVKGGDTIRHDGSQWVRDNKDGPHPFQDPFSQARKNMHAMLEIVEERSSTRIRKSEFVHGYAVVFPHMDYEGQPPANGDRAIVISRRHLPTIQQAILTAYKAWTSVPRKLRPDQYRMLLNECVMPRFRIFRPIGPNVSTAVDRLLELTETQAQVFKGLYSHDRVLVSGVAGSGKTFLALERALSFSRCGKRTLFVCYNRELASWLHRQVAEDPDTSDYRNLLEIVNFHALASDLAQRAEIKFAPSNGTPLSQKFWDEEVPDLLEQAVLVLDQKKEQVHFDAIVVDEAQDFSVGWWYALTHSLLESSEGPIYAFMDPNQSLRGEVIQPPVRFDLTFQLTINCRNTRKIAAASASVLHLEPDIYKRAPIGSEIRLLRASTDRQQKSLVVQEIKALLGREDLKPKQIAVIGPAAKNKGSLSELDIVDGTSLITSVENWTKGMGVLVTTARSFKGLEADVVLLYDLGDFGPYFRKEDLYVACTRARAVLIAIVHGDQAQTTLREALDASEAQV